MSCDMIAVEVLMMLFCASIRAVEHDTSSARASFAEPLIGHGAPDVVEDRGRVRPIASDGENRLAVVVIPHRLRGPENSRVPDPCRRGRPRSGRRRPRRRRFPIPPPSGNPIIGEHGQVTRRNLMDGRNVANTQSPAGIIGSAGSSRDATGCDDRAPLRTLGDSPVAIHLPRFDAVT